MDCLETLTPPSWTSARPRTLSHIFSYLTCLELIQCYKVSTHWQASVKRAFNDDIHEANLTQFWTQIGIVDTQLIVNFLRLFGTISSLDLSFCTYADTEVFSQLTSGILSKHSSSLKVIRLFYLPKIDDSVIDIIVNTFPQLEILDIGHCPLLTVDIIPKLSTCLHLNKLILRNNPVFNSSIIQFISLFPSLRFIDVTNCSFISEHLVELSNQTDNLVIEPKHE